MKNLYLALLLALISLPLHAQSDVLPKNGFKVQQETGMWVNTELEQYPAYREGEMEMLMTMYRAIRYPARAREKGIQGTVLLDVTLDESGTIVAVDVLESVGGGCDEEAISAVYHLNGVGFLPAVKNGRTVPVRFELPVAFRLQ